LWTGIAIVLICHAAIELRPDLIFLGVHMPSKNSVELLQDMNYGPEAIDTAAHADYTIQAFELDMVESLLEPVSSQRFEQPTTGFPQSAPRGNDQSESEEPLELSSRLLLRDGQECHWVRLQEIVYFESCANHTVAFWSGHNAFIYRAIGKIEIRLPKVFFRVSRQHIVNVESVDSVELWVNGGYRLRLKTGTYIEVSRRHAKRFKETFSL
jgi:two-component system, LytTR family, response regulator